MQHVYRLQALLQIQMNNTSDCPRHLLYSIFVCHMVNTGVIISVVRLGQVDIKVTIEVNV